MGEIDLEIRVGGCGEFDSLNVTWSFPRVLEIEAVVAPDKSFSSN